MNNAAPITKEQYLSVIQERDSLRQLNASLEQSKAELEQQLEWFKRQYFGRKSEKQLFHSDPRQLCFGESVEEVPPSPTETVKAYERRITPARPDDGESEPLLRFDDSVPVQIIEILPDEVEDLPETAYEVISEKITHRLAQRPGAYVVLKYVRKVVKLNEQLITAPVPETVLERSFAAVSLLAGILIDKFLYHLPLYRQHQRLKAAGIEISRATLTNYVHRAADLLAAIYYAQLSSILQSKVLLMDETPVKARRAAERGTLKQGWYWPLYGDQDEVAFPFGASRAQREAKEILGNFCETLVTDGYSVYERIAAADDSIRHAQCWVHTRRQFVKAEQAEPDLVKKALELIAKLYHQEEQAAKLAKHEKLKHRAAHSMPLVDEFFSWLRTELGTRVLLPSNPFTKAAAYALERERALRVFLDDAAVPLDTNALERALRPIPMGRKNWLFCWTEVGAEVVGHVQSLLVTCKLQGVDPYTYLVDVLQRVGTHPAIDVHLLTPRLWKENFAAKPMRSELDCNNVVQ